MRTLPHRVVLVTGANRGLGLATTKELLAAGATVWAGVRDPQRMPAMQPASALRVVALDVRDPRSCHACIDAVTAAQDRIDGLVNNAGILPDEGMTALDLDEAMLRDVLETNLFGAWRLCRMALPLMLASGHGRIVNIGSGWGASTAMDRSGTPPAYGLSKLALHAVTRQFAACIPANTDVSVNTLDPGWVRTAMGGAGATRMPREPAREIVAALAAPAGGPSGILLRHGRVVDAAGI